MDRLTSGAPPDRVSMVVRAGGAVDSPHHLLLILGKVVPGIVGVCVAAIVVAVLANFRNEREPGPTGRVIRSPVATGSMTCEQFEVVQRN